MPPANFTDDFDIKSHLAAFTLSGQTTLFGEELPDRTQVETIEMGGIKCPKYINEFWTSKQRQASPLHEVAYRACFKPQLPRFFIKLLTKEGDTVYDPFTGRGTTVIEAALLDRDIVANDINPISIILSSARLRIPNLSELKGRLAEIPLDKNARAEIDLSMFYHPQTLAEIVSLKNYLRQRKENGTEDALDSWIRMVATNRLTGHSPGFFSVYTLPPNQAVSPSRQQKINEKRNQAPEYRDVHSLILRKSRLMVANISGELRGQLNAIADRAIFLTEDARNTVQIQDESVQLTVTSPPFLNVVQYADDNWLRCWFNDIDATAVAKRITVTNSIQVWSDVMGAVFRELSRVTRAGGWVAFEVGEVRNGKVKLEEYVIPLGVAAGLRCEAVIINQQTFTKTSNIWGIKNNKKGTNSNRIVLFRKDR